jgi:uncharacterized protein (UPF0332 family)
VTAAALTLARHRLADARSALEEAEILIANGRWRGALNRVYYGAFYAARAVLATRKLDSSKHSGVIALFQQHFVKPGLVTAEVARALPRAFEKRLTSDYGDFAETTPEDVLALRVEVSAFVDECARLVEAAAATPTIGA